MRRTIRRGLKIARRDSSDCKSYTKSDTLSLPYLTPLFMSFLEELSLPCLQIINNTDSDSHGKMGHGRLSSEDMGKTRRMGQVIWIMYEVSPSLPLGSSTITPRAFHDDFLYLIFIHHTFKKSDH